VSIDFSRLTCTNEACDVNATGKCVEGIELAACSHLVKSGAAWEQIAGRDDDNNADRSLTTIALASGECLSVTEAGATLRARESKIFAIIGPTDSGKTSLIGSLYEMFQKQDAPEYSFAGSRTLIAFEQACHPARAVAKLIEPSTPTTPHSTNPYGVNFYHLALRTASGKFVDLLMADRTGEDYRSATDDLTVCTEFVEIQRADTLTFLLNGELLLDDGNRHNVVAGAEMLIQSFIDAQIVDPRQRILFVLTKVDVVHAASQARTERDFAEVVQHIQKLHGANFSEIAAIQTAASPKKSNLPHGFGVSDVLRYWMTPAPAPDEIEDLVVTPRRAMSWLG
jgi:energy-coupling factor transporter ATP-binding protein EcfA2